MSRVSVPDPLPSMATSELLLADMAAMVGVVSEMGVVEVKVVVVRTEWRGSGGGNGGVGMKEMAVLEEVVMFVEVEEVAVIVTRFPGCVTTIETCSLEDAMVIEI